MVTTATPDAWLREPPPLAALESGPEPARIGNVSIGTASWTERTLLASRSFYPPGASTPERRLRYYARHFPVVEVDMVYADQKEVHHMEIKTKDAVDQREEWTARANVLMTATEFPRKPGKHCDWCSFSQRKGGPCNELP